MVMARSSSILKILFRLVVVLILLGGVAGGLFFWVRYRPAKATESSTISPTLPRIDWDARYPDMIRLPADYSTSLRVQTAMVQPAPRPEPLRLRGSLMLDANRLARVKCFFSGQVISIGKADERQRKVGPALPANLVDKKTDDPGTLRYGDFVKKDQVLAIVWSKDVGAMKSQLVTALSQLDADQKLFDRYVQADKGVIAQKDYDNARKNVEADLIQVAQAERTLRSYRLTEDEILAVRREAEKLSRKNAADIAARTQPTKQRPEHLAVDPEVERTWAETAVRSSIDGIIVEKNVTIGDVVDNTTDLFKIVDLSHLQVMVNAYEEDLAALRRLKPEQMRWKIYLDGAGASKPIEGEIDQIGRIIDPTQHTGLVTGWLPNPGGDRLIGEFVTARVDLPSDPTLVAIPASALIEEGDSARVLVSVNGSHREFTPRPVAVVQRGRRTVLVRAEPNDAEKKRGVLPLRVGEEVVTTGNLQLAAELANFKASPAGR
jgi:cobalt-zinc-cadmium efflux system membrane fusion protein